MVGMGMDFARCEGEKVGLETPELVGIPNFIRGRSSETALSSPGLLTHGPARGSKQNLLLHPPLLVGLAQFQRVLLSPLGVRCLSRPFPGVTQALRVSLVKPPRVCVGVSGAALVLVGTLGAPIPTPRGFCSLRVVLAVPCKSQRSRVSREGCGVRGRRGAPSLCCRPGLCN